MTQNNTGYNEYEKKVKKEKHYKERRIFDAYAICRYVILSLLFAIILK